MAPCQHFNYTYLRNAFRTALLNEMESRIGSSFKKTKAKCYTEHKHGFYVYAKPNKCDPETVVKYIGRYLGRPVIATSRIDKYDGRMVTFHYNRHEDDKYVEETIPAIDFIRRLIRHIPEKHFKMIRYGGIYARHRESDKRLRRAISREKHHIFRSFNQWRNAILISFGYDPLECPDCKHNMKLLELYYNHQRVSLEEMYEKAMSKSRGMRSSA
ncbi:MAG: transposase [Lachnospiraceae bacterium]|nr:transposase [Lachnospiraceae bacterium]